MFFHRIDKGDLTNKVLGREDMHKKIFDALNMLNLLGQAIYTLALPIGLGALASFLLTEYAGAPGWIWAILLTLGTLMGLYSMVKYILSAMTGIERQKKQREADLAAKREKEDRQAALREASKKTENNDER